MIKRATEVRLLPDPTTFEDWRDWARQTNIELQRQLMATSMILPFFEFGQVERTTDYTPAGVAIPWQLLKYDNTNGIWVVGSPTRLTVPQRAGQIKYGYGQVVVQLKTTDPAGGNNTFSVTVKKNGLDPDPRGGETEVKTPGAVSALRVNSPWYEVNAGDYFEVFIDRTGSGTAQIAAGIDSWAQLLLSGPA